MSFFDSSMDAGAGNAERIQAVLSAALCMALDNPEGKAPATSLPADPPTKSGTRGAVTGRRQNMRLGTRPPASTARITLKLTKVRFSPGTGILNLRLPHCCHPLTGCHAIHRMAPASFPCSTRPALQPSSPRALS